MDFDLLTLAPLLAVCAIGLAAGILGGMLGVGGSVIMIPALTLVLGYNQHLYQAAAMIVNVVIAFPAVVRHRRAGTLVPAALKWMLPAALVFVLVGVWLSNRPAFEGASGGLWLGRVLAVFLLYVIVLNVLQSLGRRSAETRGRSRITGPRGVTLGGLMGTVAGLLGIGGGALAVPLQQTVMRLPLRDAIANSTAIICISSLVGAIYKNATLARHATEVNPVSWEWSLLIAALLAPTAFIGARWGASLTHALPIRYVRLAFVALMLVAAWRMAAIPGLGGPG